MIYVNNELVNIAKDKRFGEAFANFKLEFSKNFDDHGRLHLPIIVQYKKNLIKNDPHNRGKFLMPKSIQLDLHARTIDEQGHEMEIRYSKTPGRKDNAGNYTYTTNSIDVVDGRYGITDAELAFFLYNYSNQIASNPKNRDNPKAKFEIENLQREREIIAEQRILEATIKSRIWNEVGTGGVTEKLLREIGKSFMIPKIDQIDDVNELKLLLERTLDLRPELKQQFLDYTKNQGADSEEVARRRAIVADAIEHKLITHDKFNNCFRLKDPVTGKSGASVFTYKKGQKNVQNLLYTYLEDQNPTLIESLEETLSQSAAV